MEDYVRQAPMKAMNNRKDLSNQCGCYNCLSEFPVIEIKEWTDGGKTAICPKCNVDSVLPICDSALLKKIRDYWFA